MSETLNHTGRRAIAAGALFATFGLPFVAVAQSTANGLTDQSNASVVRAGESSQASLTLPDAPGSLRADGVAGGPLEVSAASDPMGGGTGTPRPEASRTTKVIEPGQAAPILSAGDKALLGVKDAFAPLTIAGWVVSAGYTHLVNGSPNYGTDRGAFGQRLGAAAIRNASEGLFTNSVMAPLLREDPRYYRQGPTHNFFSRVIYAGSRPLITRTDAGRTSPNLALLAGNLGGAGLTNLYYPEVNRGATQTMETFGGSLGGSALSFLVSEFFGDVTHLLRLERN